MIKRLFNGKNVLMVIGIPYGIFLNYSFYNLIAKDVERQKCQKINIISNVSKELA